MKHTCKRLFSLAIVLLMLLAIPFNALADNTTSTVTTDTAKDEGNFTITLTSAEDNHTFKAYQVFAGSVANKDGSVFLGEIEWASGVNTAGIKTALEATGLEKTFTENGETVNLDFSKANDVARAMARQSDDSAVMQKVADAFYNNKGTVAGSTSTKEGDDYKITGLKAGYYLVTDEYTSGSAAEGAETLSRNILAVTGDVTAEVKNDKPDITKKIVNKDSANVNTNGSANATGIGDTVVYEIGGKVPDYTGYTNYFYVINDTLSNGLTFNGADNLVVKVDGTPLTQGTDYVVYTGTDASPYTFQVAFKNIKGYTIGKDITVTYSATVNENAKTGSEGNPNTASLTYSNDPKNSSGGNPSDNPKPGNDIPTGQSTDKKTLTFVIELDLTKYADKEESGKELDGAQFSLTGTYTVTKVKTAGSYVADTNGIYYKLKDGTYTTTAPHGEIKDSNNGTVIASNEDSYDSTTTKYSPTTTTEYETETKTIAETATTAGGGKISFKHLGAGTFTLTEIKAPDGFNVIEPTTFTVSVTLPTSVTTGSETATWSTDKTNITANATNGVLETKAVDKSGRVLPSTGGMGTTIFYAMGTLFVVSAGILLVTKKRLGRN